MSTLPSTGVVQGSALEIGYRSRGLDVQACDMRRALAVQIHDAEHAMLDKLATGRAHRAGWGCRWFNVSCD